MKQETIPERAEEALSRRLAELPVQQMPESLKQDIVRRTERTVRRRKRTGKVWRATAVAVGGRTLVVLGPDLRTLLQSIAGTCIAAVQPICLRYLHLYTVLAGTAALAAFYFAVNAVLERKRRDV